MAAFGAVTADKLPKLETIVLAVALVVLLLDAGGGPGWGAASGHAVLASRMDHLAAAPLYDLIAGVAALVPAGEVGFRLGVLAALLGAFALAGVVAAVRALLPREVAAGLVAVALLLVARPVREAAAFASPAMLAACGAVWAFAFAARYARDHHAVDATCAAGACAVVVGSAPWLGAALSLVILVWLWRSGAKEIVTISLGALGLLSAIWWFDAVGKVPGATGSLRAALAATGGGAAAIVVGAGLLGVAFGAVTGLSGTRVLALLVAIAAVHEIVVGGNAPVVLVLLSIGSAIVAGAVVRVLQPNLEGIRRQALAALAGIPLVAIALVVGPTITVDDPGAAPTELATDVSGSLPPGPGVFVATRSATWFAMQYEGAIAGARPDLTLVPPLPPQEADAIVANALRTDRIAGADASAFGRLDVRRAQPRDRGFQLLGAPPPRPSPVEGPASYASRIGQEQAVLLAIERALHEAASARLDAAARALGLESRFGAADLAILAATMPGPERPALFGFLPTDDRPPGPWLLDVFGDDLAWVAGLPVPPVGDDAPLARRLHAKWRDILLGKTTPDDPAIAAMGPRAVAATKALFTEVKEGDETPPEANDSEAKPEANPSDANPSEASPSESGAKPASKPSSP